MMSLIMIGGTYGLLNLRGIFCKVV